VRQPALPSALVKSAQQLVDRLATNIPDQAAVAWVHSGALVQHSEALGLSGPGQSIKTALETVASLHPALQVWCDPEFNPLWKHPIRAADEQAVTDLWAASPLMDYDQDRYGKVTWPAYPLGDLYQLLSGEARKGRALCQTPYWIGELLLHTSYDRAVEVWDRPRIIDPACGPGHLLVESLHVAGHSRGRWPPTAAETLDLVHGVDLDPYAVAIARYRLLVRSGLGKPEHRAELLDAPVHVVAADALLDETEPLLRRGQYHVVVANPPYITVKDRDAREAIRQKYKRVCSGTYGLHVPFEVLFHELLVPGGWAARLTGNSFMKREFGRPLINDYFPTIDMQWVIDSSGAYIPGHGTPTVILVSRNQAPSSDKVRSILGKRGEATRPADPAKGLVWSAIRDAVEWREAAERFGRGAEAWTARGTGGEPAVELAPVAEPAATLPVTYSQPSLLELLDLEAAS